MIELNKNNLRLLLSEGKSHAEQTTVRLRRHRLTEPVSMQQSPWEKTQTVKVIFKLWHDKNYYNNSYLSLFIFSLKDSPVGSLKTNAQIDVR